MSKLILILIPIAASNIFGIAKYMLIQIGMVEDIDRLWRGVPLILGIILSVLLTKAKSIVVGVVSMSVLVIGAVCSLFGMWLGLKLGSNIAVALGLFWLLAFSAAAYGLPSKYMVRHNT